MKLNLNKVGKITKKVFGKDTCLKQNWRVEALVNSCTTKAVQESFNHRE